jgi:hypothetical protein
MKLLFSTLTLALLFTACDPQSCRDCKTFNFDLTNWSIMDDTIANKLRFIDTNFNEYNFELISVELSEPYVECQITSAPEGVSCFLTKRIRYSCDSLNLDFRILYEQIEVLNDNPAYNDCLYLIEFVDIEKQEHLITLPLDILHEEAKEYRLEQVTKYELANHEYTNVHRMNIDQMIVYDTYRKINSEYVEAKYLKEVIFQIPNGIVGLTLEDGKQLILMNE